MSDDGHCEYGQQGSEWKGEETNCFGCCDRRKRRRSVLLVLRPVPLLVLPACATHLVGLSISCLISAAHG